MGKRFQINKRATKGYRVIEYLPNFGGFNVHEVFGTKKDAKKFIKGLR